LRYLQWILNQFHRDSRSAQGLFDLILAQLSKLTEFEKGWVVRRLPGKWLAEFPISFDHVHHDIEEQGKLTSHPPIDQASKLFIPLKDFNQVKILNHEKMYQLTFADLGMQSMPWKHAQIQFPKLHILYAFLANFQIPRHVLFSIRTLNIC
jgi:hypothetical protein